MLEHYLLVDIKAIDLKSESPEYKAAYQKIVKVLKDKNQTKGVYLWGKPGAGKSWLAAAMCNYYAQKEKSVAFVNVPKLMADLKLFIFDEPTRGIDVGAKSEIYRLMDDLVHQGAAVLMISSDLPEVLGMSDRIYVMSQGRITGELDHQEADQKLVLRYAYNQGGQADEER